MDPGARTPAPETERGWLVEPIDLQPVAMMSGSSTFCFATEECEVAEDSEGNLWCRCTLEGVTTEIDGGDGEPWPLDYPFWPEAPGWPGPWTEWATLPGTADPPDGEGCDLMAGECDWKAEVKCPTDVPRGTQGTCFFSLEGPLDQIHSWTFSGDDGLNVQRQEHQSTWSGTLVQSGEVKVQFTAGGREGMAKSRIEVRPRSGGDWDWTMNDGIDYSAGTLSTGPLDWSEIIRARLCHPGRGCGAPHAGVPQDKWFVQPQNPTYGNGYIHEEVTDYGPNEGAWFVAFSTVDVKMASAVNPDYGATGPVRSQGCSPIDSLNIWDYNHSICGTGNSGWGSLFLSHVWSHEQLHVDKGVSYLAMKSEMVVPSRLESVVRDGSAKLNQAITEAVEESGTCFGFAAAFHGTTLSGPTHTPPTFDIWQWSSPLAEFYLVEANTSYPADATGGMPTYCP